MLTKNKQKFIRSLALKKVRDAEGVFLAEGPKVVEELLDKFVCLSLLGTHRYLESASAQTAMHGAQHIAEVIPINDTQLSQLSLQKTPHDVIAVFQRPEEATDVALWKEIPTQSLALALDDIQDPGNLGTIIRLADWFGIEHIFCSPATADAFSPKTVQATMGALGRVRLHYTPLPSFIQRLKEGTPIYGTFLDGENLYSQPLTTNGLIVMGNEGNGISPEIRKLCTHRLLIPNYPAGRATSESLNVSVATAIICSEFRRQAVGQE